MKLKTARKEMTVPARNTTMAKRYVRASQIRD